MRSAFRFQAVLFDLADTSAACVEAELATLAAEGTHHDEERFLREIDSGSRYLRLVLEEHGLGGVLDRIPDDRDVRHVDVLRCREQWLDGAR